MTHIEIQFTHTPQNVNEILIALLSESGFHGFEEDATGLKAFIEQSSFDKEQLDQLIQPFQLTYTINEIAETNWNVLWESNFHPIIVGDFCAIRADFHEPALNVRHEIIITPKMSFGTGHHPTTFMMIRQMEHIDFKGKTVLDFGTGTGVLALLSQKLHARRVVAIDNDDWSIENAEENFRKNHATGIELMKADTPGSDGNYNIILANITRNVILDNFSQLMASLTRSGILLLSGLLAGDEEDIVSVALSAGLQQINKLQHDNWICLEFRKE